MKVCHNDAVTEVVVAPSYVLTDPPALSVRDEEIREYPDVELEVVRIEPGRDDWSPLYWIQ